MKELHLLVDYENVQPSLEALAKLAPGFTDVWLFHGPKEDKKAQAIAASHMRVTLVPHSGRGKNALDFHLSFYLGYVAAKHPDAELVVVANDTGYDSMIDHAKALGFAARRDGYKVPATKKATVVKSAASTAATAAAKKVAAKKTVAKKAVTKQVAPMPKALTKVAALKQAPVAKKAPAKKGVAEKAVESKAAKAVQPSTPSKPAPAPQVTLEAKILARIQKGFIQMGSKAPQKVKPFLRHVGALLGKDSTAEQIDAMVAKLEAAGSVWFIGDEVVYGRK